MQKLKSIVNYFSAVGIALWCVSVILITVSFFIFDRQNYITLAASLIGVTALTFCAKGNPVGQALMVVFGLIYGWISLSHAYYGELITYVGMTVPMAVVSLVSWLKNPYKGKHSEVKVNHLRAREIVFLSVLSALVTVVFYFVLKAFGTASLLTSTLSVTTSFFAVCLTFRRSPLFALAYALNDVVLIVLWIFASHADLSCISVIVCFVTFLVNDLYSFFCWLKMQKRQKA